MPHSRRGECWRIVDNPLGAKRTNLHEKDERSESDDFVSCCFDYGFLAEAHQSAWKGRLPRDGLRDALDPKFNKRGS
ncbi:hypothetical protein [Variovorax durovernensis]